MQDNFAFFFKRVLEDEGTGYEDVPGDNGGPTKCGITIADVARFNGVRLPHRGAPGWDALVAKVRELDPAKAGIIYKKFYWDAVRADGLPSGLDYSVVDYAVNSGTGRAVPVLRHIVGVPGSLVVDDPLLDAIRKGDLRDFINRYQDERRAFLEHIAQIPHNAKFRTGWLNREARVRKIALNLASAAPVAVATESPKAVGEHPNDVAMGVISGAASGTVADSVTADKATPLMDRIAPNAAKVEELAGQGSRIAEHIKTFKAMLWKGGGTAVAAGSAAVGLVDPTKGNAAVAGSWGSQHPFLLAALCVGVTAAIIAGYAYYKAKKIEKGLVTAVDDGRYEPRGGMQA